MKKVVVIGPESTGKSMLSEQLAAHFNTVWVPEYARGYLDALGRPYEQEDLLRIAEGQLQSEDAHQRELLMAVQRVQSEDVHQQEQLIAGRQQQSEDTQRKLLICDTDLHVIKVWSEAKYGTCDARILEMIAARKYDLYLLTYIDIPWQDDPLREHPHPAERSYFYEIYRDVVINSGTPWADIRGSYEERFALAVAAIKSI